MGNYLLLVSIVLFAIGIILIEILAGKVENKIKNINNMATIQNIDLDVNITEVLNQIDEHLIIEHYGKDKLLEALGYYKDLCFSTDSELKNAVERDSESLGIELKPEYDTINDQDVYDRFVKLLGRNNLTYMQWDNFLTKYE